jgi:hypothetical protein
MRPDRDARAAAGRGLRRGTSLAKRRLVRSWWWLILLVLGGCISAPSCDINFDPCPGHGVSGFLEGSDCDCPLASQIGPQLQGQPCSQENLVCWAGSIYSADSCRCASGSWYCEPPDLALPRDLSSPPEEDAAPPDLDGGPPD